MIKEEEQIMTVQAFSKLSMVTDKIDDQNKLIIDKIVHSFLKANNNIIRAAYRNKNTQNSLHYSVVLTKDNFSNRNKIFRFFEKYDLSEYSKKYPVYFQFVPAALVSKMDGLERIDIV